MKCIGYLLLGFLLSLGTHGQAEVNDAQNDAGASKFSANFVELERIFESPGGLTAMWQGRIGLYDTVDTYMLPVNTTEYYVNLLFVQQKGDPTKVVTVYDRLTDHILGQFETTDLTNILEFVTNRDFYIQVTLSSSSLPESDYGLAIWFSPASKRLRDFDIDIETRNTNGPESFSLFVKETYQSWWGWSFLLLLLLVAAGAATYWYVKK